MADADTLHRVEERIEVTGADKAAQQFEKVTKASERLRKTDDVMWDSFAEKFDAAYKKMSWWEARRNRMLREAGDGFGKMANSIKRVGEFGKKFIGGGLVGSIFKGNLLAHLAMKAFNKLSSIISGMGQRIMRVNRQFESAQGRVQGLTLGLSDWGDMDPGEQVKKSLAVSNVAMEEFQGIALKTATPVRDIERAWSRVEPVLAGMGRDQKEVMDLTQKSSEAAKVYGERADMAGSIVAKAIQEGVVEGETAFARAFKAQAGITSKMKVEERIKRVNKTLAKMGGPIEEVTKDVQSMTNRWKILTDDVLQKTTRPAYEKIGKVVGGIVNYLRSKEEVLHKIAYQVGDLFENFWSVGVAAWDTVVALNNMFGVTDRIGSAVSFVWEGVKGVAIGIDAIATGWKIFAEAVDVFQKPGKGFAKLLTMADSFEIKIMKVVRMLGRLGGKFAQMAGFDVLEKVPGLGKAVTEIKNIWGDFEKGLEMEEELLAKREKRLGMDPSTSLGRELERRAKGIGLDKAARDALLKSIKGLKVQQTIHKVEVRQDFRDQDPDRVLVEFAGMLTRLGENPLQSTVGGAATAFGPASAG
jgi:hypothetical protein